MKGLLGFGNLEAIFKSQLDINWQIKPKLACVHSVSWGGGGSMCSLR